MVKVATRPADNPVSVIRACWEGQSYVEKSNNGQDYCFKLNCLNGIFNELFMLSCSLFQLPGVLTHNI